MSPHWVSAKAGTPQPIPCNPTSILVVVVVSIDLRKRAASVVTDGKPHRHGLRCPDLSALALGLELEAFAAPGLDLHFQPRASRNPFELERAVPVAPERALGDRRREGPDLENHILGERMNPVAPRTQSERSLYFELALVSLIFDLNLGLESGELQNRGLEDRERRERVDEPTDHGSGYVERGRHVHEIRAHKVHEPHQARRAAEGAEGDASVVDAQTDGGRE